MPLTWGFQLLYQKIPKYQCLWEFSPGVISFPRGVSSHPLEPGCGWDLLTVIPALVPHLTFRCRAGKSSGCKRREAWRTFYQLSCFQAHSHHAQRYLTPPDQPGSCRAPSGDILAFSFLCFYLTICFPFICAHPP